MRIAIFGNKSSTEELILHLIAKERAPAAVITVRPGDVLARNISGYSSRLVEIAQQNGIKVLQVNDYSLKSSDFLDLVREEEFDLGIVTGWQRLIPKAVLQSFAIGVFGWHGSCFPFPNGRGRSPLNWSIRLGGNRIYHNFFRYDEGADTGRLYETFEFSIEPEDYIQDLQLKALAHIKSSSFKLIHELEENGSVDLAPQPAGVAVEFPKITPEDGRLQQDRHTVEQAINIIRASSRPFPGAFVYVDGVKIVIWRAEVLQDESSELPRIDFTDGVIVLTDYE